MQSLEIAVFEAKDPDGFAHKQSTLHTQLHGLFAGYVGSIGLRSVSEPHVFADLVLWESVAAAHDAAAALNQTPELEWFQAELGAIRLFDHVAPAADWADLAKAASAPLVEVVLVKPAEIEAFTAAHTELHDRHLSNASSVVSNVRLLVNENGIVGDINGWVSSDAMEKMGPAMMEHPELGSLFDPQNEILLFMPFTTNVAP